MSDATGRAAARRWDELLAAHPETTDYLIDRQRSPSRQSHGHPLCSVARPVFISGADFDIQHGVVREVVSPSV